MIDTEEEDHDYEEVQMDRLEEAETGEEIEGQVGSVDRMEVLTGRLLEVHE